MNVTVMIGKVKAMSELKLCPFCGWEASIEKINGVWSVTCDSPRCPVEKVITWGHKTKEEAIEAWNRRAGDDK